MSQSNVNTIPVPGVGTDVPPPPMRQPGGAGTPPARQDEVLSWQEAMARAEQGTPPAGAVPCSALEATGTAAEAPPTSEWSPMNPNGTPAASGAGEAPAVAGAQGPMQAPTESGAPAQAMPGAVVDPSANMSPEELLQRKWDRIAMGLEPGAAPADGSAGEAMPGAMSQIASPQADVCVAQPVTLAQPVSFGWQGLTSSERPVADGMTVGELTAERRVEAAHANDRAFETGEAQVAEQARLTEVNTPETLPERTIESV